MTALDQSFIKAYLRHGGVSTEAQLDSGSSVRLDVVSRQPTTEPRAPEPGRSIDFARDMEADATEPAVIALSELDSSAARPSSLEFAPAGSTPALENVLGAMALPANPPSGTGQHEPPPPPRTPAGVAVEVVQAAPATNRFEPLLRIDSVDWPRPSMQLRFVAGEQIDRLADTVVKAAESGNQLIGVAAFSHGEGATTVLLAVTLRLVERGLNTLVVDADIASPTLPEQLGLAADAGWRDVLLGPASLEDVVTKSESESVALLPYHGRETGAEGIEPSDDALKSLLDRLRSHYDIVLFDLGGSLTHGGREGALAGQLAARIDSILTIHDSRRTTADQLAMLRRHFRRLGVAETGIVENFVDE